MPVSPGGAPAPALEGLAEIARCAVTEQFGNPLDRQGAVAQVVAGQPVAHLVEDTLIAAALGVEATAQGAGGQGQLGGNLVDAGKRPGRIMMRLRTSSTKRLWWLSRASS